MKNFYIDVREADEFNAGHIEGSLNAPLSKFEDYIETCKSIAGSNNLTLVCKSGVRSQKALSILKNSCATLPEIKTLQGGIDQWQKDGNPVKKKGNSSSFTIMRQVMLIAGILVLLGTLSAVFINKNFIWLAVFVGAGLSFAGATGVCFMAKMLAYLPWNK